MVLKNMEIFPFSLHGRRIGRRASYPSGLQPCIFTDGEQYGRELQALSAGSDRDSRQSERRTHHERGVVNGKISNDALICTEVRRSGQTVWTVSAVGGCAHIRCANGHIRTTATDAEQRALQGSRHQ